MSSAGRLAKLCQVQGIGFSAPEKPSLGNTRRQHAETLFGLLELWFAIWILHADQSSHWRHVVVSVCFKPALHHCGWTHFWLLEREERFEHMPAWGCHSKLYFLMCWWQELWPSVERWLSQIPGLGAWRNTSTLFSLIPPVPCQCPPLAKLYWKPEGKEALCSELGLRTRLLGYEQGGERCEAAWPGARGHATQDISKFNISQSSSLVSSFPPSALHWKANDVRIH